MARGESIAPAPKAVVVVASVETKVAEPTNQIAVKSQSVSVKASIVNPIQKILLKKSSEPVQPHEFIIPTPVGLTAEDVDIIKLTAQYTAANGREFLAGNFVLFVVIVINFQLSSLHRHRNA